MKRQKGKIIGKSAIAIICAIFIIPAMAMAFGQGNSGSGMGKGHGMNKHKRGGGQLEVWRNPEIVKELGLSDEQVKGLKEADFAAREKHLAVKAQLDKLRLDMDKAFAADKVDENAVRQLAERIADLKGKSYMQRIETRLTMGKLLSEAQHDKLKTLKKSL